MKELRGEIRVRNSAKVLVDENIWNEKEISQFDRTFYDAKTINDIGRYALEGICFRGEDKFIEGFGYIKVNGEYPFGIPEEEKCLGIEINNFKINWEVDV